MVAPTDRRDDRVYVYTERSSRRLVARPIAAIDRCDRSRDRSLRRSLRVNTPSEYRARDNLQAHQAASIATKISITSGDYHDQFNSPKNYSVVERH